jgi:hypothetical protein
MNDNDPIAIGDTVRLRDHPLVRGTVWSIERGMIIVAWDDQDENVYVRDPRRLEKIIPAPVAVSRSACGSGAGK